METRLSARGHVECSISGLSSETLMNSHVTHYDGCPEYRCRTNSSSEVVETR